MLPDGLCDNPECGAFLDQPSVPHRDQETGRTVFLCVGCTRHVGEGDRYKRLDVGESQPNERSRKCP